MAHAIIFVDRAPLSRQEDYTSYYMSYAAGAYKVASVIRDMGLDVLVVPNCFSLTFEGIKQIIENNKNNLLWVGISTTFMALEVDSEDVLTDYRNEWRSSKSLTMNQESLMVKCQNSWDYRMVWDAKDIAVLGAYLNKRYKVPLLLGGYYADIYQYQLKKYRPFDQSIYSIKGYAENYVKDFTERRIKDSTAVPEFFMNNSSYDDNEFKHSTINWHKTDFINENSWLEIETARGCAFDCAYCNYPRRNKIDSFKDPKVLRQELIRNYEKFGVTRYNIIDDLYNDSKEKVRIFHEEVWSNLPFKAEWAANMRLDMIWSDPDSAEMIKQDGCKFGQFGIETLHDVAGKKVGKGLGKKRILETLEFLKPVWGKDVLISANLIAGLPFEPLESIRETMEWSTTTDLIYNPNWCQLYITKPSDDVIAINNKADGKNKIEKEYEKFQVEWLENKNWKNSAGVTYKEAQEMVKNVVKILPMRFKINIRNYIDLRIAGFSHERLANVKTDPLTDQEIDKSLEWCKSQIEQRIQTLLNIKS